jgi:protein involved in polysaccharide export with SLBB domain
MLPSPSIRNLLLTLGAAALAVSLAACAAERPAAQDGTGDATQSNPAAPATVESEPAAAAVADISDNAKLQALWNARSADQSAGDFTLGPGDVLQVSVPAIEELKDRSVRISADDTIALPLIGVVDVKGMTEQDVRNSLKKRLEKYMYEPQVEVFAKEYQSRQVAVVGMVQKPGLYSLTSPTDTVLSMISRAGGTTETAAQRILLIPAPPGQGARTSALLAAAAGIGGSGGADHAVHDGSVAAAAAQPQQAGQDVATHGANAQSVPASYSPQATTVPPALAHTEPILIDLSRAGSESHLDIPARPGDVIIVPAAGEVMVKGWVQNAGAFKITPGMTVLGAVTAAGGQMFSSSGEILRTGANGGKAEIPIDLSAIEKGQAPDVPVQAGDVVIVNRSVAGAVPYALYTVLSKFGTGIYPAVPFF